MPRLTAILLTLLLNGCATAQLPTPTPAQDVKAETSVAGCNAAVWACFQSDRTVGRSLPSP